MPWGSFATWSDAALDSFVHGVEWAVALVLLGAFLSYGVAAIASVWRRGSS